MMLDLGTFLGAPVLGMIGESYGFSMLFATIGTFNLVCGLVYASFTMGKRKRTLEANDDRQGNSKK